MQQRTAGLTPWAVMIESFDADIALGTVSRARRPEYLACPAPLQRDPHAIHIHKTILLRIRGSSGVVNGSVSWNNARVGRRGQGHECHCEQIERRAPDADEPWRARADQHPERHDSSCGEARREVCDFNIRTDHDPAIATE